MEHLLNNNVLLLCSGCIPCLQKSERKDDAGVGQLMWMCDVDTDRVTFELLVLAFVFPEIASLSTTLVPHHIARSCRHILHAYVYLFVWPCFFLFLCSSNLASKLWYEVGARSVHCW
jgi:hypothetical protein